MKMGYNGYSEFIKKVFHGNAQLVEEIAKIPELRVIGKPVLGNVTIASNSKDIEMYEVGRLMDEKKWQFGVGTGLPTLTCTIHDKNVDKIPEMISDFKECIELIKSGESKKMNNSESNFKIYGEVLKIPTFITSQVVKDSLQGHFEIEKCENKENL